jgi:nucleotide-binding universal stress UspA family protein
MEKRQKKILVPVDFTPSSNSALLLAGNIAALHGSELVLLHVVEPSAPMAEFFTDEDLTGKKRKMAIKLLDRLIETNKEMGVPMTKMIVEGKPYREILSAAEENLVEMIVMGTWGTHAIENDMIGSNVNKVVRSARIPVVTVTRPPEHAEMSKIMIAVDPNFGIRELRKILEQYHKVYNPVVDLVAVALRESDVDELKDYLDKQRQTLMKQGIKDVTTTVRQGYIISETILDYVQEAGHDMIWMETHGRKGLSNWIIGSVTEEVLQYSPVPVLSLRPEREPTRKTYYHSNLPI